ncbi:MAG: cupin domain-containing protein [Rhodobacteraceae bacterium]|nr:cupin domain-containing protein [Paracoccaceae bacterium]MCP5340628.1 cupin domain-containing protein [Paracoccaceae bacterium]
MPLPDFIRALPALELPFPDATVSTNAMRSDGALAVFFTFHEDMDLPAHSHKAQWGTVIEGWLDLTMAGKTRRYLPGESYSIPSGVVHSARGPAGTVIFDLFEEPDRYALRA